MKLQVARGTLYYVCVWKQMDQSSLETGSTGRKQHKDDIWIGKERKWILKSSWNIAQTMFYSLHGHIFYILEANSYRSIRTKVRNRTYVKESECGDFFLF